MSYFFATRCIRRWSHTHPKLICLARIILSSNTDRLNLTAEWRLYPSHALFKSVRTINMITPQSITAVYSAVLDDKLWQPALEAIATDFDAAACSLLYSEIHGDTPFRVNFGSKFWAELGPEAIAHYESNYAHYEVDAWNYLQQSPANTIILDTDFADAELLKSRPDYQYVMESHGICHRAGIRLNDNPAWFDSMTVQYSTKFKLPPEGARALLAEIGPHVAKATECCRMFRTLQQRYQAALAALDHVEVGLCVVTERGVVILKNQTADEILFSTNQLKITADNKLFYTRNNEQLQAAFSQCASTALGMNRSTEFIFTTTDERTDLLIEVAPLHDKSGELERGLNAALVTLIDPARTEVLDTSLVARAWNLTEVESSVLEMLVLGSTNSEMADKRNVSPETIKSQVRSVYRKTNTGKRSELIRLVARTSPPIR